MAEVISELSASELSAPVFCVMCKSPLQPGQNFCPSCGGDQRRPSPLQQQLPPQRAQPIESQTVPSTATPSQNAGPSAVSIAIGVICGVFLVIGILVISLGVYGLATHNSPTQAAETEIESTRASGYYVDPSEAAAHVQVGQAESDIKQRVATQTTVGGVVLTLPFVVLVLTKRLSRHSEPGPAQT